MIERRTLLVDNNQKELLEHGTFEFPIEIFAEQLNLVDRGFVDWHWHDELQFAYVIKGAVSFGINQQSVTLEKGSGIFINSKVLHSSKPSREADSTYICIDIHPSLLKTFQGHIINRKYITPFISDQEFKFYVFDGQKLDDKSMIDAITAMYRLNREKPYAYEFEVLIYLYTLWLHLIRLQQKKQEFIHLSEYDQERLHLLLEIIFKHYPEKLTLEDFAVRINMSNEACCRFFKKATGRTLSDFLLEYRLKKSVLDLENTDHSISEIAYNNGFSTTSFYIDRFKKMMGCTPGRFRTLRKTPHK